MIKEEEHIKKMLSIKKEIYLTKSWKRRKDLEKYLDKLEKEWFRYVKIKGGD